MGEYPVGKLQLVDRKFPRSTLNRIKTNLGQSHWKHQVPRKSDPKQDSELLTINKKINLPSIEIGIGVGRNKTTRLLVDTGSEVSLLKKRSIRI